MVTVVGSYLEESIPFDPLRVHEIDYLIPLPDRAGVLLFSDDIVYFNEINALKTLHRYTSVHSFPEYQIFSICLKNIGYFGKYKVPWVCPFFILCPLEGKDQTIWINPFIQDFNHLQVSGAALRTANKWSLLDTSCAPTTSHCQNRDCLPWFSHDASGILSLGHTRRHPFGLFIFS